MDNRMRPLRKYILVANIYFIFLIALRKWLFIKWLIAQHKVKLILNKVDDITWKKPYATESAEITSSNAIFYILALCHADYQPVSFMKLHKKGKKKKRKKVTWVMTNTSI